LVASVETKPAPATQPESSPPPPTPPGEYTPGPEAKKKGKKRKKQTKIGNAEYLFNLVVWKRKAKVNASRIRRECLDHVIIFNEDHLWGVLQEYVRYYNTQHTHLGIGKDAPERREVQGVGEVDKVAVVGGLHHFYYRRAA
jgi:hypothetical protein